LPQLARGIAALHRAGKLHRDLKPSNVLVDGAGRVVVLDFGLVDDGRADHDEGQIQGTPAYMAPEQASSEPAQPASDWYAVGVMIFEALTGRLPFCGSASQILIAKWKGDLSPLASSLSPHVPEDLDLLCAELLRVDPVSRPTGEEILRRLGVDAAGGPRRAAAVDGLLGRDPELATLRRAYADVSPGKPIVQWIHGGSGIGKSALLEQLLGPLRGGGGSLVFEGRCHACESVPYKAFDAVVDELARHLSRLAREQLAALLPDDVAELATVFPVLRGVLEEAGAPARDVKDARDMNEVRVHAFRALKEILRRLAAQRPLVIAIDDLQWGDVDSARLLRELLAAPDAPGLLFVGLYRSEDAARSTFLQELPELLAAGGREGVRELTIDLLTPSDARRLALELLGPGAAALIETIVAETSGNPFLIEEFVRYTMQRDAGAQVEPRDPPSVGSMVLARVGDLTPKARRLLEIVAVAGRSVEQRIALAAAELGVEAMSVVRALETSSLLRADGLRDEDAVEIYHDRIRESVIGALTPEVLAAHHRALGEALESRGTAAPEVLAEHFLAAGDRVRGVPYALRAAERAASALAFERAAGLYQLVLDGYTGPPTELRSLKLRRADALVNAGRCAEAAPCYLECASSALPAEALDLRRRAAEQLLVAGRVDEGTEVLRSVLAELGIAYPSTDGRALVGTLLGLVRLGVRGLAFPERRTSEISARDRQQLEACLTAARGLGAYDMSRGAYFSVETLRLALRTGEPASTAHSLAGVGAMLAYGGSAFGIRQGGRMIQHAFERARQTNNPALTATAEVHLGISQMAAGRWAQAVATTDPAQRVLRERSRGYGHEAGYGEMSSIFSLEYLGRLREVGWRADACLREADITGNLYTRVQASLYLALGRIAADDPRGGATLAREALALWPLEHQTFLFQHWLGLKVSTYCDLYAGRPAAAFDRIRDAWPRIEASSLLQMQFIRIFALQLRAGSALALAASQRAERARLLDLAERDARRLERERTTIARAASSQIRAGVAVLRGRRADMLARLDGAVVGYERAGMAIHAETARRTRGALLGGEGVSQVAAAEAQMRSEGITNPTKWARVYAPGFG
jgi:hypothetical protein